MTVAILPHLASVRESQRPFGTLSDPADVQEKRVRVTVCRINPWHGCCATQLVG
jgi:hypothetical protein